MVVVIRNAYMFLQNVAYNDSENNVNANLHRLASQVFIHSLQLINVLESSVTILASTLHFHTHKHDAQQNELWLVALNVSQKNFNISVSNKDII